MTLAEVETFKRRVRDLRQKYKHDLEQIERDFARRHGVSFQDVRGRGPEIALEAHARVYVIDPLLKELGWNVSNAATLVIEDTVEPIADAAEGNRRFLDYHGRDNTEDRSLVILEAKRPNAALPDPDKWDVPLFIAQALRDIHTANLKGPKLPGKWQEWLTTLIDYVKRSKDQFGHVPVRVTITNGEWFVVFNDVEATLLSKNPSPGNILVFNNLEDVEAQAEKFYDLLNYPSLSGHIPPQHPSALPDFISTDEEALCAQVVDVSYVRHGARQPAISIRVAAWVRTTKGSWVLFRKSYPEEFILLSHDPEDLQRRSEQLAQRADALIRELKTNHGIRYVSAAEFERLAVTAERREGISKVDDSPLISKIDRDTYRLTIGDQFLFFLNNTEYDGCPFHQWGDCHKQGDAVGATIIAAPSSDPPAFFPSGSFYHCAHKSVHNARNGGRCVLLCFEEYLCCRRCAFFQRCWPQGGQDLPCRNH